MTARSRKSTLGGGRLPCAFAKAAEGIRMVPLRAPRPAAPMHTSHVWIAAHALVHSCESRPNGRSELLEGGRATRLVVQSGSAVHSGGRDVAQSGSAPEWGSGGRGFKSRRPDLMDLAAMQQLTRCMAAFVFGIESPVQGASPTGAEYSADCREQRQGSATIFPSWTSWVRVPSPAP
jgi:hypothetical protein